MFFWNIWRRTWRRNRLAQVHLWNLWCTKHHHHHHNRFTALFPGPTGWAGARRELLDFMVQGKINRGRHTDHPAGRHSIRTNQCPPPPSPYFFLQAGCPSCHPTNSVKALKALWCTKHYAIKCWLQCWAEFSHAVIKVSWRIVCMCNRQLTEVTGLSRIGNSLVDDRKNADDETSMLEYSCCSFYLWNIIYLGCHL